jgi:hypothetical protein
MSSSNQSSLALEALIDPRLLNKAIGTTDLLEVIKEADIKFKAQYNTDSRL